MRVFIDTNIFLDVALKRQEFYQNSARVLESFEDSSNDALMAWHSLSNIHYILSSYRFAGETMEFVRDLVSWVMIPPASEQTTRRALEFDMKDKDFEDALQLSCAEAGHTDVIVTRDPVSYQSARSNMNILSPEQFLDSLAASGSDHLF